MACADRGDLVDHEEVVRRIDRLSNRDPHPAGWRKTKFCDSKMCAGVCDPHSLARGGLASSKSQSFTLRRSPILIYYRVK